MKNQIWSVAVYEMTREFGGPEEGGWWYDGGVMNHDYPVVTFQREADAYEYAETLRLDGFPLDCRAVVQDEAAFEFYPAQIPHYE